MCLYIFYLYKNNIRKMKILLSFAQIKDDTSKDITVSTGGLIMGFLFTTLYPVILALIWIKFFNGKIKITLIGIGGFLSAIILEYIFLSLIVLSIFGISIPYYIIGGICPGLFEETARYLFFIALLKKEKKKNISVSYGIGHGGIESALVGLNFIVTLILKDQLKTSVTFFDCLVSCCERIFAVIYHIASSVVVYKSVREKKIYLYISALIYHDIVDLFPLLYQTKVITNILLVELIIAIFTICISIFAFILYNKLKDEEPEETQPILESENNGTPTENNGTLTENNPAPPLNDGVPISNEGIPVENKEETN